MEFFGTLIAIFLIYIVIKWGLILIGVALGIYIIVAIIRAITNAVKGRDGLDGSIAQDADTYRTHDDIYDLKGDVSDEDYDDYSDAIEVEVTTVSDEDQDRSQEPYICPECFEPYDGIYCEACGHTNDVAGYEEDSEADQWLEGMTAMAMFDAEEDRLDSDHDDLDNFEDIMYGDEMEDDEEDYF